MLASSTAAPGVRVDSAIGRTPIARLERIVTPDMADVFIKLEGMNPGGSIKDRTALGMIVDAERRGLLEPGGTIVEPTSGNTGIGLAQVAAARGYKLILCLPSSMSEERKRTLLAYGAELVLTDPELRMIAAIAEAKRISAETGAWMPHQFENPANPRVHYETTGPELWEAMEGQLDAFVYGSGTGGTISGVGRFLKEQRSDILVVAVEPARSAVLSIITGGGKWVEIKIPAEPLVQLMIVTAERKFWRCVESGQPPKLFGVELPKPRIEAVRIVDMSSSNAWAEFAGVFARTRDAHAEHEQAKVELKALMPEDAIQAIGHGLRAKRSKSGAVSFDLVGAEDGNAAIQ